MPQVGLINAGPVFATAWNTKNADMVATGGGDDTAYIWQVNVCPANVLSCMFAHLDRLRL